MNALYAVNDRIIGEKITAQEAAQFRYKRETMINNRHAIIYSNDCNYGPIVGVRIYEAAGDNFAGHRI